MAMELLVKTKFNYKDDLKNLQTALKNIEKNDVVNIKINFDTKKLNQLSNTLNQVYSNVNKQVANKNPMGNYEKGLENLIQNYKTLKISADQFVSSFNKMTSVSTGKNNLFNELSANKQLEATNAIAKAEREIINIKQSQQSQEQKIIEQIDNQVQKTVQLREQQARINELRQAQAVNRGIEQQQKELAQEQKKTQQLQKQLELLKKEQEIKIASVSKRYGGIGDTQESLNKYSQALSSVIVKNGKLINSNTGVETSFKEMRSQLTQISGTARNSVGFFNNLADSAKKFASYFFMGGGIVAGVNAIKSAISTVVNLDTSLTELNKVANVTPQKLQQITTQAYEMGTVIGRTGKEVIDATTDFKKMGFSIDESLDLGDKALLFMNISDGITSVDESTSTIISTLKGFNMEASDTEHILDSVNEVSNNFAVNSKDLADGLKVTSTVMAQSGTSLEQTLSILTSSNEIIQDMSKTSHGIVTISERLRGLSEAGESLGTDFVPKLQKAFKEYANTDIMKDGKLRSTYDILLDTSKAWSNMSKEAQQYIAELAGGKRNVNVFNAIMSNQKTLIDAVSSGLNSQGSAIRENEKYLDSIQGKIKQFSSALEQLWQHTISSDFIKGVVDLGTGVIKLIDKLGGLNTVLMITFGIMMSFDKLSLFSNLTTTTTLLPKITGMMSSLNTAISSVVAGEWSLAEGLEALNLNPIGLAITGVGLAIMGVVKYINDFNNSAEEMQEKINKTSDRIKELRDEIEKLNDTDNLTNAQSEKLDSLNKELDLREKLLELQKRQEARQEATSKITFGNILKGGIFYAKKHGGTTDQVSDDADKINKYIKKINELKEKQSKYTDNLDKYDKIGSQIEEQEGKLASSRAELIDKTDRLKELYPYLTDEQKESADKALEYANSVSKTSDVIIDNTKYMGENTEAIEDNGVAYEQTVKSIDDLKKSYSDTASSIKTLSGIEDELNESHKISADSVNEIVQNYQEFLPYINDEAKLRDLVTQKIDEQKKSQVDAYLEMAKQSGNYYETVEELANKDLATNEEYYNQKILGNQQTLSILETQLGQYFNNTNENGYKIDFSNYKTIEEAKLGVTKNLIQQLAGAWSKYYSIDTGTFDMNKIITPDMPTNEADRIYKQFQHKEDLINQKRKEIKASFDALTIDTSKVDLGSIDTSSTKMGGSGSSKSSTEKFAEYTEQGLDNAREVIEAKSEKLDKQVQLANEKLANATTEGDEELKSKLENEKKDLLDKQFENISESTQKLANLRTKYVSDLQKASIPELKGYDLKSLTEQQLDEIITVYNQKIAEAEQKDNKSLKASLEYSKQMIDEYGGEIIKVNDDISKYGHNYFQQEKENLENLISMVDEVYDKTNDKLEADNSNIDLKEILLDDDSTEYKALQKDKYSNAVKARENADKAIQALRKAGLSDESEAVKKYIDLHRQAENTRLNLLKQEREKEAEERKKELEKKKDNLQDMKDAYEDIVDEIVKMLKKEYEQEKKLLQEQKKNYKEIIDARKEALDQEKDSYEYQKGLVEKQKALKDVQDELNAMSKDDRNLAKRKELQEQEKQLSDELNDYQYDNRIESQKNALDDEYDSFAKEKDDEIDKIDDILSKEGLLRKKAIKAIEEDNQDMYKRLIEYNNEYGVTKTSPLCTEMCIANYTYMQVIPKALHHNITEKII